MGVELVEQPVVAKVAAKKGRRRSKRGIGLQSYLESDVWSGGHRDRGVFVRRDRDEVYGRHVYWR